MTTLVAVLTQLLLGLGIGFAIGLTGIGGGVLVVPVLTQVVGLDPVRAVGTGFLYALLARAYAIVEHLRLRTVRKRTALYFILGSAPAVALTSLLVNLFASGPDRERLGSFLRLVIGFVLVISCLVLILELIRNRKAAPNYYVPPKVFPARRKFMGAILGFLIGLLVGSTSIGGGVLVIPILLTFFGLSPRDTVGTSNLISVALAVVGSGFYLFGGNIVPLAAGIMFVGSLPGVFFGSRAAARLPHWLVKLMLLILVAIGTFLILAGVQ